jgi:hypothetical protein
MTEATIRNRTLIVPSTTCNGPVMFSSRVRLAALVPHVRHTATTG